MPIIVDLREQAGRYQEEINGYQELIRQGIAEVRPLLEECQRNLAETNGVIQAIEQAQREEAAAAAAPAEPVPAPVEPVRALPVRRRVLPSFEESRMSVRDLACHTFALCGDPRLGRDVNAAYEMVTNQQGRRYNFGEGLSSAALRNAREETMGQIKMIRDMQVNADYDAEVYLCGGFREGQVAPEHMWIEDVTNNMTFDTFINQRVRKIDEVGEDGQDFRPPCEASEFAADEIVRVRVSGYTAAQLRAIQTQGYIPVRPLHVEVGRIDDMRVDRPVGVAF